MSTWIQVIEPDRKRGRWVFDDERHGLKAEPFVSGASEMLDRHLASEGIKRRHAKRGFRLLFSDKPMPGFDAAYFLRDECGGGWYAHHWHEAWFCPAILHYFDGLPEAVYFKAELIRG